MEETEITPGLLLDHLAESVFLCDPGDQILYLNEKACHSLGYTREELMGVNLRDLTLPEYGRSMESRLQEWLVKGETRYKSAYFRKDKSVLTVEIHSRLITLGNKPYILHSARDITGHPRVQAQEKQIEQYLQLIIDRMPVGLIVWDLQFRVQYWNPAAENIFGFTREEALEKRAFDLIVPPEVQALTDDIWRRFLSGDLSANSVNENLTRDGRRINCLWLNTPMKQADGTIIGVLSMVQDITQTQQAEKTLRNSERKFRSLFEQSQDGIVLVDSQGKIIGWNKAYERLTALNQSDVLGKPIWEIQFGLAPEEMRSTKTLETIRALVRECLRTRQAPWLNQIMEQEIQRPDGERRFIQSIVFLIDMDDDFMLGTLLRDITGAKRTREALEASESKFRSLINNIKSGAFRSTPQGKLLEVNPALETITGYSREELLTTDLVNRNLPMEERQAIFSQLMSHPEKATYEVRNRKKDGTPIIMAVTITPVVGPDGNIAYFDGILEDITERKRLEKQLRELYEKEKQERQELEAEARARGLFIEVLGHELRTPLTPIVISSDLLKEALNQDPDSVQCKLINNIAGSAALLVQRLDELLDLGKFSRGEVTLQRQPLDPARFLALIETQFEPVIRMKGQRLILEIEANLPEIEADSARLNQVLMNLLTNASKFSPEGGNVTLRAKKKRGRILIEVQDEGTGISADEQKRLFQPYHRSEQDRQRFSGLGLGLAISRLIIEAHGGKIWVASQPNRGSTFSFYLPVKPGQD